MRALAGCKGGQEITGGLECKDANRASACWRLGGVSQQRFFNLLYVVTELHPEHGDIVGVADTEHNGGHCACVKIGSDRAQLVHQQPHGGT